MTLQVSSYDPEFDTVILTTGEPHDQSDEINCRFGHVLDYDLATYKPVTFELLMCVSSYIPLSREHGYNPETDTLIFSGTGAEKTELVAENGDLVAHWGYDVDDPDPEGYVPVTVELRNASRHLASVIACIKGMNGSVCRKRNPGASYSMHGARLSPLQP